MQDVFVRELASSRQNLDNKIHLLRDGNTVCGSLDKSQTVFVKNLQQVYNMDDVCTDCIR